MALVCVEIHVHAVAGLFLPDDQGHELNFVAMLCCLASIRFVVEDDFTALCFRVFGRYQ